ncbi:MAG: acetyl-CoA carboxylase biotin carboxyl carrier protein [Planctomycetia bacterium]|nr:acetyl-CoA carboxylase biotin carboxyl carrier protein [Planctomycetia bacterium]
MKNTQKSEKSESLVCGSPEMFDVPKVRRFVQMMKDYDLTELEIHQGETSISLKRGGAAPVLMPSLSAAPVVSHVSSAPAVESSLPLTDKEESPLVEIVSPIVGTFFSKPDPDSSPFVSVGDLVSPEKTVCIVEAMKVFNQIPAKVSGKIVAVLVKDGDPIEYGQAMFKVDPRG